MKKLLLILTLSLLVIPTKAQKQGKCSIELNAKGFEIASLQLLDLVKNKKKLVAEKSLSDGKLYLEFMIKGNNLYALELSSNDVVVLALEAGEKVKVNYQNRDDYHISGSKGSESLQIAQKKINEIRKKHAEEVKLLFKKNRIEGRKTDMNTQFLLARKEIIHKLRTDLYDQLGSSVAWMVFHEYINDDVVLLKKLTQRLQQQAPKEVHTQILTQRLHHLKLISIRGTAPEIILLDIDGNLQKLSEFKGKYVFIDFWASWCACLEENTKLLAVYQKYKAQGLEILGVSLDNDKKKWAKVVKKEGLTWINVRDLKGKRTARTYDIKAIPRNFLVDKEGKIIAKDLSAIELDKKLKEILK